MNLDGRYDRTPTPSETSELNDMYHLADWLYESSVKNKSCRTKYIKIASHIDTIPLVNIYC